MTSFAKRHYQALAEAMQAAKPPTKDRAGCLTWQAVRNELIQTLTRDNGRFDRDRFARACEPGANVRARSSNPPVQDVEATGPLSRRLQALRALPEGVAAISPDNPAELHTAIARAVGEG